MFRPRFSHSLPPFPTLRKNQKKIILTNTIRPTVVSTGAPPAIGGVVIAHIANTFFINTHPKSVAGCRGITFRYIRKNRVILFSQPGVYVPSAPKNFENLRRKKCHCSKLNPKSCDKIILFKKFLIYLDEN